MEWGWKLLPVSATTKHFSSRRLGGAFATSAAILWLITPRRLALPLGFSMQYHPSGEGVASKCFMSHGGDLSYACYVNCRSGGIRTRKINVVL